MSENAGVTGIDLIAWKRTASGELDDIRFSEVKTRQTAPVFKLSVTKNRGVQLSDDWIRHNLGRMAAEHSDPSMSRLADELLEWMKARPGTIRRELHGIAVESNKYVIMGVDDVGRVTGVSTEGRLTSLLEMLAARGTTEETRAAALRNLARVDQLQASITKAGTTPTALARTSAQGLEGLTRQARVPGGQLMTASGSALVVANEKAASQWILDLARQPGVLAAGITFAVDEAFTGWDYYQGKINTASFQRRTAQNGIKASVVGIATQVVYLVTPTPHGLVLCLCSYVLAETSGHVRRT